MEQANVNAYRDVVYQTMQEITSEERSIIDHPDIGTVRDGGKACYAHHLRALICDLLSDYYCVNDSDMWSGFKSRLESTLETELNPETRANNVETITKSWAYNSVLRTVNIAQQEYAIRMDKEKNDEEALDK